MAELGFDVTGIRGQAAKAAALGDDLRAVQSTWETGTGSAAQALGLDVLVSAFGAMREAWVEQFTVYIDVVSKLSGHLGTAATNYSRAETANTDNAEAVMHGLIRL
jgi:hypothetical protein